MGWIGCHNQLMCSWQASKWCQKCRFEIMQDYATTKGHYQYTTSVDINNARYKRLHRAANHYVLAVVCYAQGHRTTLLCSWSYYYAFPQNNENCLFSIPCVRVGIKFASNRLHVCLFCVWDVGCATANRRSRFNQLTNHSVRFNSHSYTPLPGETTSVFNHFKSPCWSKKLKASSRMINLVHTKNAHQNFQEECYTEQFLCVI